MNEEFIRTKIALSQELEKVGSSLLDFEKKLAKAAGDEESIGGILSNIASKFTGAVTSGGQFAASHLPSLVTSTALLGGTTLGGLAYAANRSLDSEDKELAERKNLVNRYKQLTDNIKTDYGIH